MIRVTDRGEEGGREEKRNEDTYFIISTHTQTSIGFMFRTLVTLPYKEGCEREGRQSLNRKSCFQTHTQHGYSHQHSCGNTRWMCARALLLQSADYSYTDTHTENADRQDT